MGSSQTIFVPARVRVGFEALPTDAYNTLFTDPDKIAFKTQVNTEIFAEIAQPFRDAWNTLAIQVTVPDQHLTEDEIHTWLDTNIGALTGNPNITLDNNPETYLAAVEYLFWDSIRECEHKHLLYKGGVPWTVTFPAPNYEAKLFIQLAWDTPA